jgi:hypothetical protein
MCRRLPSAGTVEATRGIENCPRERRFADLRPGSPRRFYSLQIRFNAEAAEAAEAAEKFLMLSKATTKALHVLVGDGLGDDRRLVAVVAERAPRLAIGLAGLPQPPRLLKRCEGAARICSHVTVDFSRRKAPAIEQRLNCERVSAGTAADGR